MVDAMCERYHTLPTHILSQATTLDMVIFDVAMTYRHHLRQKKDPKATPNMPQEQLEEIMRKHKEKYDKS
jgi:hypothetical protein